MSDIDDDDDDLLGRGGLFGSDEEVQEEEDEEMQEGDGERCGVDASQHLLSQGALPAEMLYFQSTTSPAHLQAAWHAAGQPVKSSRLPRRPPDTLRETFGAFRIVLELSPPWRDSQHNYVALTECQL
jgi:hypothetical protein